MSWRLLESVHGHVGVLALALLIHPAVRLWRGAPLARGSRWAIALSAIATALAFALGLVIYGPYRTLVKRDLFVADARAGWLFETKEHLGYVAVALALGATALALLAPPRAAPLRRAAARMYVGAALAALGAASIGTWVAAIAGF
ncbi:hypothetical protein [Sandaracinus amylolyticus]|uniref:hypothetical protein n=1 Tax=Sandaracinus amylolyticus TaxID=927083 RepID=UPI001F304AAB|nr:hypothetical protein [Sandaracinus amylolyticus]UJR82443.1 Hypothetical protein I5071_45080 [Sandaracinus amylolyticus]